MLNLKPYRRAEARLSDHVPWAALVAPGVVLNKDGSFQRTYRYRGPDIESATETELVGMCARVNNALKRLGAGWAMFFDANRHAADGYCETGAETGLARLLEEERRARFEGALAGTFETDYYVTLVWLPDADQTRDVNAAVMEQDGEAGARNWRGATSQFLHRCEAFADLLGAVLPQMEPLDDAETLTYLHGTISTADHRIEPPTTPMYLDAVLVDTPLSGGAAPRLGTARLRTLSVLGFPDMTRPGLLDALNQLDVSFRWTTRFIPLDKTNAVATLTRLRRHWFAKRKSMTAMLREVMYSQETRLTDPDADNKVLDAEAALAAVGGDHVAFGYLTTTLVVKDEAPERASEAVRRLEQTLNGLGFATIDESFNGVEAWLGSLPGHVYANVRQPLVHTLNLSHLMPLSSVWAGPKRDRHLDGPPLFYALAAGATPFRFSLHVADVGHMMVVGPTGAGKSVLLAFMLAEFQRYPRAQAFAFDKGGSTRATCLALGGRHYRLGRTGQLAFQPLRNIDYEAERAWALDWLLMILAQEAGAATPEVKAAIWSALGVLATAPVEQRTMSGLVLLLPSRALKAVFEAYTVLGAFGRCLDAEQEDLDAADLTVFETEDLLAEARLAGPMLSYLFHRLEARFDGRPTLLMLDEAWVFLDNPLFAARIREWLKVLRKRNVSVVFATQSLADIIDSAIAPAILESCPQRLFLPNDRAREPLSREAYTRLGLNERQIDLIAQAIPKRHYYLQSQQGNRLFDLDLGPLALSVFAASGPEDQRLIDALLEEAGAEGFGNALINARGPVWARDLVAEFVAQQATESGGNSHENK
ncbi:MAG TPA: conjugal transfer protein TrbE [Asticcacaulis sp.]|nr:conjugal transfer protein TrbE [Asticcacaulis sp.]